MKTHHLKIDPLHYSAILRGEKTFEVRKNDRDFTLGDIIHLRETTYSANTMKQEKKKLAYTGRDCYCKVVYLLKDHIPGVQKGFVIMGIQRISDPHSERSDNIVFRHI